MTVIGIILVELLAIALLGSVVYTLFGWINLVSTIPALSLWVCLKLSLILYVAATIISWLRKV